MVLESELQMEKLLVAGEVSQLLVLKFAELRVLPDLAVEMKALLDPAPERGALPGLGVELGVFPDWAAARGALLGLAAEPESFLAQAELESL